MTIEQIQAPVWRITCDGCSKVHEGISPEPPKSWQRALLPHPALNKYLRVPPGTLVASYIRIDDADIPAKVYTLCFSCSRKVGAFIENKP